MATDIVHSNSGIADAFMKCSNCFKTLIYSYSIAEKHIKDRLPHGAIADELGRFRVWSGSALADQRGIGSLEYRLQDASNIASQVLVLLNSLHDVLEEMREILDGERPCLEDDSDSVSDCSTSELRSISEEIPDSELDKLLSTVAEIITCLLRLSIAVHDPAPHDQIISFSSVNNSDLEKSDIEYVQGEFPNAEKFLKERLGRAMSHWRHYIQYRVDQHKDLGNEFGKQMSAPAHAEITRVSRVSHLKERLLLDGDNQPGSSFRTTSKDPIMPFAQGQDTPSRSYSPSLDQTMPYFECPVCIRHVRFRTSREWKDHVYQDLQAYVCTFEDCLDPDRRFDTREEWFDHEMQTHRRWWECIRGCDKIFQSPDTFRVHFRHHHSEDISKEHLHTIMRTCSRSVVLDTQANCPLCELSCPSLSRLYSHLGQHQENLCLFVLPADVMDHVRNLFDGDVGGIGASNAMEDPSTAWPMPSSLLPKNSSSRTAHVTERQEMEKPVGSTANPIAWSSLSNAERIAIDSQPPVSHSESEEDIEHRTTPRTGKGEQAAQPQRSQITETTKTFPPNAYVAPRTLTTPPIQRKLSVISFGFSPSDVVKLLEISTRVFITFKDANENSEVQVESLVREFQAFAQCLLDLDKLMKEFGKPIPFPVEDFKKTLERCEASLKPYKENLVDKKMGLTKMIWAIKYIGKQNEIDQLRKQITGHCQVLHFCLIFIQLRLNLESSKREQRLLAEPRHRALSLGGQWYSSGALNASSQSSPSSPLALPAPEEAHPLYKDWEMFNRWLKNEDESMNHDLQLDPRLLSWGDTLAAVSSGDAEISAVLYRLQCEVQDAILFEENRSKRTAIERRSQLAPSDAMKQQVREMPQAPGQRISTLGTITSTGSYSYFDTHNTMDASTATMRPDASTPSPKASPSASPRIEEEYFTSSPWVYSPSASPILQSNGRLSFSTIGSRNNITSDSHLSPTFGVGINSSSTVHTTPDNALSNTIRDSLSTLYLTPIVLGHSMMGWNKLCRKVKVERKSTSLVHGKLRDIFECEICDVHWSYRENRGISLIAKYRSTRTNHVKVWTQQDFPAIGPAIPLTTTIDGEVSIDFPRGSFGTLDKSWADIRYTFADSESSVAFQSLLYTNNGKDAAELLFDRPIRTIFSDKNKPECRGRNLRLWRRTEVLPQPDGPVGADVLILLFYTSCLEEKGHWVEEPHHAFEWLTESTCKKKSDSLSLVFSKDSENWTSDKLFQQHKSSTSSNASTRPISKKWEDSMEIPGITRSGTGASSASSIKSTRTFFARSKASTRIGNVNPFGYAKLDIEFQSTRDRRDFVVIWQKYVKALGSAA